MPYATPPPGGGGHVSIAGEPVVRPEPQRRPEPGVLDIAIGLSASAVRDDAQLGDSDSTFTFFENVRAVIGREVGWATGADLMFGTTGEGGFVYELNLYAAGVGLRSERGAVSLLAGGGMGGITGDRVGFGLQLPIELHAVVPVGDDVRLRSYARAQFVFEDDARQNGSDLAPFGDELRAGVGILFGHDRATDDDQWGYWTGVSYSELMGVKMITLDLGGATSHSFW